MISRRFFYYFSNRAILAVKKYQANKYSRCLEITLNINANKNSKRY